MDIYEEIQENLRQEWQKGATQQEMADKYKTTNQHINRLVNDLEKVKKIGLQTFLNMFPHAKIDLTGANTNIHNSGNIASNNGDNGIAVSGNNNNFLPNHNSDFRNELILELVDSEVDPVELKKVLSIIKNFKK